MTVWVLVVLSLGAATGGAWALTRSSASAASPRTRLVAATTRDLSQTVMTTGTVQPKLRADLSFAVSGRVTSVAATVGQKVSKGAVLATVDSTLLASAVTTAVAGVTAAQQQLASLSGGTATQVTAAQAQLAQAESQLAAARDNLAAASLTAPFAGVVASVGFAVGDTVGSGVSAAGSRGSGSGGPGGQTNASTAAGSTSAAANSTITLISTTAWVVDANVGSADLAQLKQGQQAQIVPTGSRTTVFGTVASVGIFANGPSGGSATFPVVIDVTGAPSGLYAGGSTDVTIIVKKLPGVLTVPTQAIVTENGRTVVHQLVGGKQVSTPVAVGATYGPLTEIRAGLKAGDQVAVTVVRVRGGTGGAGPTRRARPGGGKGGGSAPVGHR